MRAFVPLSVLVAAALAGCGGTATPPASPPAAVAPPAASTTSAPAAAAPAAEGRCHTGQLSARLGAPTPLASGQSWLPLSYTNTSDRPCLLRGIPGADLHGPADPNGPVYSLFRQGAGGKDIHLRPGASASARLVVLSYEEGSVGSFGSTRWVPTQLVTIPPGETTPLTARWPTGLSVLRQDAATHPGSWIEPFAGG